MEKKKIVHIIQSLDNGGCENMLLRTLPLLQAFDHIVITLKDPGELAPQFTSVGITVETIHCDGFYDISGIRRLRTVIHTKQPSIIITYLFHADMIGRMGLYNVTNAPVIPFLRTTYNHPKYLIARIVEWLTKPLVKQYLANSEAVKDFYTKHIGVRPKKITVIPNGIDTDYFDSILPDPKLRESLGIRLGNFVIICVANLHINKGHQYLLEAFETVNQKYPETHLLIVGDGAERNNLKNQLKEYQSKNNISFLGRRTDVPQLLKISDCFVLPTLFEGQSNALMEAMASGLPVITTDIPENRNLVENNTSGFLVPIKNSTALSEAIQKIYKELKTKKTFSEKAKNTIHNFFSLEKIATKWEDTLVKMTD